MADSRRLPSWHSRFWFLFGFVAPWNESRAVGDGAARIHVGLVPLAGPEDNLRGLSALSRAWCSSTIVRSSLRCERRIIRGAMQCAADCA